MKRIKFQTLSKLLSEYNILDVFEVYRYEHIFRDALQHIEGR